MKTKTISRCYAALAFFLALVIVAGITALVIREITAPPVPLVFYPEQSNVPVPNVKPAIPWHFHTQTCPHTCDHKREDGK